MVFFVVRRSRDRKVRVTVGDIFASGRTSPQVRPVIPAPVGPPLPRLAAGARPPIRLR